MDRLLKRIFISAMSVLLNNIFPLVGCWIPIIVLASVDLPLPFGPVIIISSPGLTVKFRSCKIVCVLCSFLAENDKFLTCNINLSIASVLIFTGIIDA